MGSTSAMQSFFVCLERLSFPCLHSGLLIRWYRFHVESKRAAFVPTLVYLWFSPCQADLWKFGCTEWECKRSSPCAAWRHDIGLCIRMRGVGNISFRSGNDGNYFCSYSLRFFITPHPFHTYTDLLLSHPGLNALASNPKSNPLSCTYATFHPTSTLAAADPSP
jgi:hypothetical protein